VGGGTVPGLYWVKKEKTDTDEEEILAVEDFEVSAGESMLTTAFAVIKADQAKESSHYLIVLGEDETDAAGYGIGTGTTSIAANTGDKKNLKITVRGAVKYENNYDTNITVMKSATAGALFTVYGNDASDVPELILEDITLQGISNNNKALVVIGSSTTKKGKLTMKDGGRITGNTNSSGQMTPGGGVQVAAGNTFTMEGGKIDNNHAKSSGGYYGGYGGGVYAGGTFTMSGGSIENNSAGIATYPGYGGGVYASTFTMSGGVIKNNECVKINDGVAESTFNNTNGGGVYASGTFIMSGNAEISDNSAETGGGVSVGVATFDMQGGTIARNRVSIAGAAVAVSEYSTKFLKSGGVIYGTNVGADSNKATDGAGSVHSIEIYEATYDDPPTATKFYYDDTANIGIVLDSTQTGTNWIAVP
jgi:hypothetical protein